MAMTNNHSLIPQFLMDCLLINLSPAISCLLSALTIDLSQYAMDIGKAIASKAFSSKF